jgi:hypothetical protein
VPHLARQERAVLDPVLSRVPHGVGHRGRRDLDAIDPAALAGEQEADRTGSRVEIHHRLGAGELARRLDHREEPLGLHRVGLEERARRDLEREPAQRFADVLAPEQKMLLGSDRDRRLLGVHVQDHAGQRRNAGAQLGRERGQRFHVGRRRDNIHHRLAGASAFTDRGETQEPFARILVVDGKPPGARLRP